jgi:hypothetical protein
MPTHVCIVYVFTRQEKEENKQMKDDKSFLEAKINMECSGPWKGSVR